MQPGKHLKPFASLTAKLTGFFKRHPDRSEFAKEFVADLNLQGRVLHLPGGLISLVAWLGFALDTDRKLHPEFPELFYLRIALSCIAALQLLAVLGERLTSWKLRGKGLGWMYVLYGYLFLATSFFTGRIAADANYVSGLQIVILIAMFIPFPLKMTYAFYFLSMLIFGVSVSIYHPDLTTEGAKYSMQNLVIAYALGLTMSAVLDHYRFHMFNNNRKLAETSREIQDKMTQVLRLKEQQDGDYFLTSLLLQPLIQTEVQSRDISLSSIISQYKKFEFKYRQHEIGGDYICAHRVELRGSSYTAFINGDAMGKSMQGAGGALVLGTVFRSVIERTSQMPEVSMKYPETWLKECFEDLQNVFSTFDGSMLISAVIGLLDDSTGLLYFINAEHPLIVLYRKGKAEFLEEQNILRKIGVMAVGNSKLMVRTFQLQPQDVLLIGSDGRDDLDLGLRPDGSRFINEDERRFLQSVEESGAELDRLVAQLQKVGSFTDDLSLIRLGYREDSSIEEIQKKQKEAGDLRAAADRAKSSGDLVSAMDHLTEYIGLRPDDIDSIHEAAYLSKFVYKEKRDLRILRNGIELCERVRLRDPSHLKNLINLADLNRILGNKSRAAKILEEVRAIDPNQSNLKQLSELVTQMK